MSGANQLLSVQPEELMFQVELEKQTFCDLTVTNNTENYVAFKVKTTSPKKYFVRPNSGIVQPWDSSVIRVTLQAQGEYPADMQCNDKFLLQSTKVQPHSEVDELPPDTFTKEGGRKLEERRLRVVYSSPQGGIGSSESESLRRNYDGDNSVQNLRDERDTVVRQTRQLQQELDMLKRQKSRKGGSGFSLAFAIMVAIVGIIVGFLMKIAMTS